MSDEVNTSFFYMVFGISWDTLSDNSFCDDTNESIQKYYIFNVLWALILIYYHQKKGAFILFSGKQVFAKIIELKIWLNWVVRPSLVANAC